MSKGKFIIFEGMDGCGKTSLLREVAMQLTAKGVPVKQFAFPSAQNGVVGKLIRDVLDGNVSVSERTMLWLFTAEGVEREQAILSAMSEGFTVLCDRHTAISACVYQAPLHGFDTVDVINQAADFNAPTHIYIVDVPVDVALARRGSRGRRATVLYEPTEIVKLEAMREEYRNLVEDLNNENGMLAWSGKTAATLVDGRLPLGALAHPIAAAIREMAP
jgi:dTMP kinase